MVLLQDGKSGRTILHYAVESNDKMLVYQLFKYPELNINAVTFGGVTAFCLADDQNNELMRNILRTNGASLFYRDSSSEDSDDDTVSILFDGSVDLFKQYFISCPNFYWVSLSKYFFGPKQTDHKSNKMGHLNDFQNS